MLSFHVQELTSIEHTDVLTKYFIFARGAEHVAEAYSSKGRGNRKVRDEVRISFDIKVRLTELNQSLQSSKPPKFLISFHLLKN